MKKPWTDMEFRMIAIGYVACNHPSEKIEHLIASYGVFGDVGYLVTNAPNEGSVTVYKSEEKEDGSHDMASQMSYWVAMSYLALGCMTISKLTESAGFGEEGFLERMRI